MSAAALFLALTAEPAHGEIVYVGSSTIGEHVIEAAATAFAATTGIRFSSIQTQGSGKGLEMVLQGEAQLAGVARSLTPAEKWRRLYYEIIGYDALTVFVHPDNPVKGLSRLELRDIFAGRITNWKQVGGRNAPIVPAKKSGTFWRIRMTSGMKRVSANPADSIAPFHWSGVRNPPLGR